MSRVKAGLVAGVVAAVASVWTISLIGHRWTDCRGAAPGTGLLVVLLPVCFLLEFGTGALCGWLATRTGLLRRFRDPGLATAAVITSGVVLLSAGLVLAAGTAAPNPVCSG